MKRKYVTLLHIAFWSLLLVNALWGSLFTRVFDTDKQQAISGYIFFKYFIIDLSYLLIPICCFYLSYLAVATQIIKKNYVKTVLYTLLTLAFITALRYLLEYYFFLPVFGFDNYKGQPYSFVHFITNVFFYYFPAYFIYGLMYFFIVDWYKNKQNQQEVEKEKAAAELTFLRSQINPHFLFNSINDIYSLTYQQSALAPTALLKLSDILRYMLREGKEDTLPLQSEVNYLENVIELQRISAKGNAFINFTVEGYIGAQKIATLLLIAFVENAFKHGVLTDAEHPVEITLQAMPEKLQFEIRNKKNKDEKDKTGGIGLNNVKRRLHLLYPHKHVLTIEDSDQFFAVNLALQMI